MRAIVFIVRALLQLVVTIFLLRVLLPLVRADARNQLSQAVIRLTNRVVLPLRRMLPPIRKVDTASIRWPCCWCRRRRPRFCVCCANTGGSIRSGSSCWSCSEA